MTGLIFVVVIGALGLLGFWIGSRVNRSDNGLGRKERKELESYRNFMNELSALAAYHSALGDSFAVIALDKMNEHRKELQ